MLVALRGSHIVVHFRLLAQLVGNPIIWAVFPILYVIETKDSSFTA